jgi:bacitracin transport system ATP-binding protein
VIEVQNLTKKYKIKNQEVTIFENLNFTLETNSVYIITGSSGSGKSTLLNILSTVDREYEGTLKIENKTYLKDKNSANFRKKNIGFIFQSFELLSDFTLRENCLIPLEINKIKIENVDSKIETFFDKNKYSEIKEHFPHQLSGGEQQRTAIARALIHDPSIIIADEPTGNLDKKNSEKVIDVLLNFMKNREKMLIIVTHDKEMAPNISQKTASKINNIKINQNIEIAEIKLDV